MRKVIASFLFLLVMSTAASESLCKKDEEVVFSCNIKGSSKIVSVCSSRTLTREEGYLQYRFGTPIKLDIEYPPTKNQTQEHFYWGEKHPYQSSVYEFTFINSNYFYTVSRYEVSEVLNDNPGGYYGGDVTVQKKGESKYKKLECAQLPEGTFQLQGVVRDDEDLIGK